MLRLAAREADVVNLASRVRPDGTGPDASDSGLAAFLAKIALVRASSSRPVELGTSILDLGTSAAWSHADTSGMAETPQVLRGTARDMADKLLHWRAEHGLTYYVLHHETDLPRFLPVLALLR